MTEEAINIEDLIEDQKHYEKIYYGHMEDAGTPLKQSFGIIYSIESVKTSSKVW